MLPSAGRGRPTSRSTRRPPGRAPNSGPAEFSDDRLLDDPVVLKSGQDLLGPDVPEAPRTDPREELPAVGVGVQRRVGDLIQVLEEEGLLGPLGRAGRWARRRGGFPMDLYGRARR